MNYTLEDILEVFVKNLSIESAYLLIVLYKEKKHLHKELLRDVANEYYLSRCSQQDKKKKKLLILSRHKLDIHTARIEGAGLVNVTVAGRVRLYSLSDLGLELLRYIAKK